MEELSNSSACEALPRILGEKRKLRLDDFAVGEGGPSGVYLVPDWLTEEEAANLAKAIDAVSVWRTDRPLHEELEMTGSGAMWCRPPRACG